MPFSCEIKLDDLWFLNNKLLAVRAFLQSVPARVGAWRGGWRRQGDGGRGLHWVIHGQDQAGAPDRHFVFR